MRVSRGNSHKLPLKHLCFCCVRVLPDDEWFNEICQDAIERLSGKSKADRDLNSPTASVSAQSISSVRSHGSY